MENIRHGNKVLKAFALLFLMPKGSNCALFNEAHLEFIRWEYLLYLTEFCYKCANHI